MAGWRVQAGLKCSCPAESCTSNEKSRNAVSTFFITGGSLEQWFERFGNVKLRAAAAAASSESSPSSDSSDPGVTRQFPKR